MSIRPAGDESSARSAASAMGRARWTGIPHEERVRITAPWRAAAAKALQVKAERRRAARALQELGPVVEQAIADGRLPEEPTTDLLARIGDLIAAPAVAK